MKWRNPVDVSLPPAFDQLRHDFSSVWVVSAQHMSGSSPVGPRPSHRSRVKITGIIGKLALGDVLPPAKAGFADVFGDLVAFLAPALGRALVKPRRVN